MPTKKVSAVKGKSIEWYLSTLDGWQRGCVEALVKLVATEVPGSTASIKWAQPVWEHCGPFAYVRASKKHVTVGFWRGVELSDPAGTLEGDGARMKHLKLYEGQPLPDALAPWLREAAALNVSRGDPTKGAG